MSDGNETPRVEGPRTGSALPEPVSGGVPFTLSPVARGVTEAGDPFANAWAERGPSNTTNPRQWGET
jgi:hypothetical protein